MQAAWGGGQFQSQAPKRLLRTISMDSAHGRKDTTEHYLLATPVKPVLEPEGIRFETGFE
jgi:hypothetical protein